ncbi:unnamed protein product [Chrysoparadoxa australica]
MTFPLPLPEIPNAGEHGARAPHLVVRHKLFPAFVAAWISFQEQCLLGLEPLEGGSKGTELDVEVLVKAARERYTKEDCETKEAMQQADVEDTSREGDVVKAFEEEESLEEPKANAEIAKDLQDTIDGLKTMTAEMSSLNETEAAYLTSLGASSDLESCITAAAAAKNSRDRKLMPASSVPDASEGPPKKRSKPDDTASQQLGVAGTKGNETGHVEMEVIVKGESEHKGGEREHKGAETEEDTEAAAPKSSDGDGTTAGSGGGDENSQDAGVSEAKSETTEGDTAAADATTAKLDAAPGFDPSNELVELISLWFLDNKHNMRPSQRELRHLARGTGLRLEHVSEHFSSKDKQPWRPKELMSPDTVLQGLGKDLLAMQAIQWPNTSGDSDQLSYGQAHAHAQAQRLATTGPMAQPKPSPNSRLAQGASHAGSPRYFSHSQLPQAAIAAKVAAWAATQTAVKGAQEAAKAVTQGQVGGAASKRNSFSSEDIFGDAGDLDSLVGGICASPSANSPAKAYQPAPLVQQAHTPTSRPSLPSFQHHFKSLQQQSNESPHVGQYQSPCSSPTQPLHLQPSRLQEEMLAVHHALPEGDDHSKLNWLNLLTTADLDAVLKPGGEPASPTVFDGLGSLPGLSGWEDSPLAPIASSAPPAQPPLGEAQLQAIFATLNAESPEPASTGTAVGTPTQHAWLKGALSPARLPLDGWLQHVTKAAAKPADRARQGRAHCAI